jgi:hypothetical protein
MRLSFIDYNTKERSVYFDPRLYWRAEWSDVPRRDTDGTLLGWDRTYTGDPQEVFVPARDDASRSQHELAPNSRTLQRVEN